MESTQDRDLTNLEEISDKYMDMLRMTRIVEGYRNDVIRMAIHAGVPVTQIARAANLSRMRIYQIRDLRDGN